VAPEHPGPSEPYDLAAHAHSFGAAADAYARARPGYPDDAVDFLVGRARRVLDLGAGTGKFTASLAARGLDVVAVEPSTRMLAQLRSTLDVEAHEGTAEATGLPDASVDAVVVAQAWHWVDPALAVPEVARVLRPGGTLGLVWNVRDESVPWVARLWEVAQQGSEHEMRASVDTVGAPFGAPEHFRTRFEHATDRAGVLDLVASRSYVIVLPEAQRAQVLADVARVLDEEFPDGGDVRVPYVTHCSRFTLS
jgi:SAM-dependent methyltransferase